MAANSTCDFTSEELRSIPGLIAKYKYMEARINACEGNPEAHYNYAYLLERLQHYNEALQQYMESIKLKNNIAKYYFGAADVLLVLGDINGAIEKYTKGLTIEPDNKWAKARLQKSIIKSGKSGSTSYSSEREQQKDKAEVVNVNTDQHIAAPQTGKKSMIQVENFWIDTTETSIFDYLKDNPGYTPPADSNEMMPAIKLSYKEALRYAQKHGKRICTADEWKKALAVSGSMDLDNANLYKDFHGTPYSVFDGESDRKSPLLNMIGNASEWVLTKDGTPALIGGHWYSSIMLQSSMATLLTPITVNDINKHMPHAGVRLCKD